MTGKITGALREQSDWAQQDEYRLGFIKNKPFYDTRKSEEWTLTLDASTFKKEDILGNILLKISDKTMSVEEFGKVRYRVYMDGEMVLENTGEATEEAGGYACCGLIMYLEEKQVGLAHVTPGLYLPISEEDLAEGIEPGRCFYEFYFPSYTTGELKTIDPKYFGKVINFDNYYFTTSMFPDAPMSLTMIVGFLMGNDAGDNSCLLTNEMAKQLAKELNEDDDIVAQFSTDNNMYTKVRNCKVTVIKDESGKTRRVHGFIFPMNMSDGANVNYTIIFMPFENDTVHVEVVR